MKKIIFFSIIIIASSILYGAKSYSILSRGLVKDNSTKLIWTRCPLSTDNKPIYDFQCIGEKKLFTWEEAIDACENLNFEGRSDWRLPNINELQSIAYYHHYVSGDSNISQVVESVFPTTVTVEETGLFGFLLCLGTGTCYTHYWSSTLKNQETPIILDFNTGSISIGNVLHLKAVRCVAGP